MTAKENGPRPTRLDRVAPSGDGRLGWKTRFLFATLIVAALFVFQKLPQWGEERSVQPRFESASEVGEQASFQSNHTNHSTASSPSRAEPGETDHVVPPGQAARNPSEERAATSTDELEFRAAVSEAFRKLHEGELRLAKESFEKARVIRPDSREAVDGVARVDEELRLRAIARHRDEALAYERNEDWLEASSAYEAVLGLDPTIRFALEGRLRTRTRASLEAKLAFHIGNSHRLSDESVWNEARRVLVEAGGVANPGAKHLDQTRRLTTLVEEYATPIPVELVSDSLTEVTVYRVGRLGRFERRTVELRPGTYTVVGSRAGFRDVRHEFVLRKDTKKKIVAVRCTEAI